MIFCLAVVLLPYGWLVGNIIGIGLVEGKLDKTEKKVLTYSTIGVLVWVTVVILTYM